MFNIGELGGTVKIVLFERGIDVLCVSPTSMKSAISGDGKAKKPQIQKALRDRYGIQVSQHDEADAVALMLLGEMKCGSRPIHPETRSRFAGVEKGEVLKGRLQPIAIAKKRN